MIEELTTDLYLFKTPELPEPTYQLRRLDKDGKRRYYRFDKGEPIFYFSVTTFLHSVLPTGDALKKHIGDLGYEEAKEDMEEKADYGTFMHIECLNLLIKGDADLDGIQGRLSAYAIENDRPPSFVRTWLRTAKKDLLAFAQFVRDYKVRPIFIEVMLCSDKQGFAGGIDLVCRMTVEEKGFFGEVLKSGPNKGAAKETKREVEVTAVVDLKSGRKGFWESHEIQLEMYRRLLMENYPELKIDRLYNWSPKDWTGKEPTYNLKDQTNSKSHRKLLPLLEAYRVDFEGRDRTIQVIEGTLSLNDGFEKNILYMQDSEYVKRISNG